MFIRAGSILAYDPVVGVLARAGAFVVVIVLALGPGLGSLCDAWCHDNARTAGECRHDEQPTGTHITGRCGCEAAAATVALSAFKRHTLFSAPAVSSGAASAHAWREAAQGATHIARHLTLPLHPPHLTLRI